MQPPLDGPTPAQRAGHGLHNLGEIDMEVWRHPDQPQEARNPCNHWLAAS